MASNRMDANQERPLEVAIVGAGIAGLTLALGLLHRGIRPTVYERQQSLREIGAGIGFTANAERAMLALHPEILTAFKRVAVQNGTDWFFWRDGQTQSGDDLIHQMYLGERGFEGCLRADLLEELAKLIPEGTVQYGKGIETIVDTEQGSAQERVKLNFHDGSSAHADVVIGCDGLRSRVRHLLLGTEYGAQYTHKYAYRGLIPMADAKQILPEERALTRNMYLGQDSHALTFPVAGGKILNFVAFTTDPQDWQEADRLTAPATKSEAVEAFSQFNGTLKDLVALLPERLDKWAVFDMHDNPAPSFNKGRICLAGDAAHAAAPYHGAGAGFAVEDAVILSELLRLINDDGGNSRNVRAALETYSSIRLDRARWLVDSSRYIGRMYQWQEESVDRDHVKCAEQIERRNRRIWDYDIQGMIDAAKGLLGTKLSAGEQ